MSAILSASVSDAFCMAGTGGCGVRSTTGDGLFKRGVETCEGKGRVNDAGKTPVVATCANGARGRGFLARALAHGKVMISIETGSEGERTIKSGQSCNSKTSIPAWAIWVHVGQNAFSVRIGWDSLAAVARRGFPSSLLLQ